MNNAASSDEMKNSVADDNPFVAGSVVAADSAFGRVMDRFFLLVNGRMEFVKRCAADEKREGKLHVINEINSLCAQLDPGQFRGTAETQIKTEIKRQGDELLVRLCQESAAYPAKYKEGMQSAIGFFVGRLIVLVETE